MESKPETTEQEKIEYEIDEKKQEELYEKGDQIAVNDDEPIGHVIVEEWQFTWRASVVGSLLGCLIGKEHNSCFSADCMVAD